MPRKVFVAGEILTAADVNTNLMDQAVQRFADSTARGSAIPSPTEGMVTYLDASNLVEVYNGSAFTPIGRILQVVSTTKTDGFVTSSTSYTTITGLTASITPVSSTSKVLIFASVHGGTTNSTQGYLQIVRDSTAIFIGDAASNRVRATSQIGLRDGNDQESMSLMGLDSPGSTSSITYALEARTQGTGTVYINRSQLDQDLTTSGRTVSTITVLEVAG